ncbi:MAG: hypothetical protein J4F28_02185 [Nitrosopumilaceae archaeon]|nr:hypothetical protein [Nitrosopumilaceae archaeon]
MSAPVLRLDMESPVGKSIVFYCVHCKRNVQPLSMSGSLDMFCPGCHGTHIVPRRSPFAEKKCWGAGN